MLNLTHEPWLQHACRRCLSTSHAREAVSKSTNSAGPPREWSRALALWRASPLFTRRDEGDGRNDVRVARARPIVAETRGSWPCGQMLPRRRDRAGTRTWRSIGVTRRHCPIPPAAGPPPNLSANSGENRLSNRTKLHPTNAQGARRATPNPQNAQATI